MCNIFYSVRISNRTIVIYANGQHLCYYNHLLTAVYSWNGYFFAEAMLENPITEEGPLTKKRKQFKAVGDKPFVVIQVGRNCMECLYHYVL